MSSLIDRAQVLAEAMPYIQKYNGKTVVVKYGGNAMISEDLRQAVISDLILLSLVGVRVVVVHGGGPEISDMLKRLGHESKFVDGLRYTDEETMEVVQQVLCGKVNKDLAALINGQGGRAVGLCGIDAGLFQAVRLDEKYGLVGSIQKVVPDVVEIPTLARGVDGPTAYNVNADTAAAKLAIAMNAEKLLLLTDVRGLLTDPADEVTLIPHARASEIPGLVKDGVIKGGMIPKIDCAVEAVRSGVRSAVILDGRIPHSILIELLSDAGVGTMITV